MYKRSLAHTELAGIRKAFGLSRPNTMMVSWVEPVQPWWRAPGHQDFNRLPSEK